MTYEAHKEYLAKMYEEYQRQEEENIKKGKKGSVSTISGLSAQPAATVNGTMEIRELDDTSQTQTPESEADYSESGDSSRNLLAECKGPEGSAGGEASAAAVVVGAGAGPAGVRVEVHDLLVDIKAEKVEATEVKLDDLDLSPEVLGVGGGLSGSGNGGVGRMENGPLVEVDFLLDSTYCASMHKLNGSLAPKEHELGGIHSTNNSSSSANSNSLEDGANLGPLITLADEKDMPSVPSNNGFLFPKGDEKLLPSLASPTPTSTTEPLVLPPIAGADQQQTTPSVLQASSASDDLSLLAHMTTCGSDLGQTAAVPTATTPGGAAGGLPENGQFKLQNSLVDISTLAEAEAQASARALGCSEGAEGTSAACLEGDTAAKAAGDATSTTSDTERSDDGKEMKKIQTTATTQVRHHCPPFHLVSLGAQIPHLKTKRMSVL